MLANSFWRWFDQLKTVARSSRRRQSRMVNMHFGPRVTGLPIRSQLPAEAEKLLPSTEALLSLAKSMSRSTRNDRYPSLVKFARDIGLSEETLIASYELEDRFHDLILAESSSDYRRRLNDEVYTKAFELYGVEFETDLKAVASPKDATVHLLRAELEGRSILDVGCGGGAFLLSCDRNIEHKKLMGIDVFAKDMTVPDRQLVFRRSDVVNFEVDEPFDVVITDNVFEHIAPQDVDDHLKSIHRALKPGGTVIMLTPHRAFGPWDVTRIVDNSNSGWIGARGTHLNESTYGEVARLLRQNGFRNILAVHPKKRLGLKVGRDRVPVDHFSRGETRPILMRFLQGMDKRFRYQAFEICVIGTRVQ